ADTRAATVYVVWRLELSDQALSSKIPQAGPAGTMADGEKPAIIGKGNASGSRSLGQASASFRQEVQFLPRADFPERQPVRRAAGVVRDELQTSRGQDFSVGRV